MIIIDKWRLWMLRNKNIYIIFANSGLTRLVKSDKFLSQPPCYLFIFFHFGNFSVKLGYFLQMKRRRRRNYLWINEPCRVWIRWRVTFAFTVISFHVLPINLDVWNVRKFGPVLSFHSPAEHWALQDLQFLQWSCMEEIRQCLQFWARVNCQVSKKWHYSDTMFFFFSHSSNPNPFFPLVQITKFKIFQLWEYYYHVVIFLVYGFYPQKFNTHFL